MLEKLLQKECCGCGACAGKCPQKAIEMKENSEGFLYPVIDADKCINCFLCQKICPVINFVSNTLIPEEIPECYAAAANDELRKKSSSGGIFSVLALHILGQGGAVAGAAFKEDGKVEHILIDNADDLSKLQGSKYLQSNAGKSYALVKKYLDENRLVLFSGTPCQIAGIKSFLGKDYDNLYLMDIICHGTPSPKIFQKYLSENFKDGKFISTNFRDKVNGWSPELVITTVTTDGASSCAAKDDDFMRAFLNNLCLRKSCGECKFNSLPRQGDLSCGDFWGVDVIDNSLNDELGLSEILVNTPKGKKLLDEVKEAFKTFTTIDLEQLLPFNPTIHISGRHHGNRDAFFKDITTGKSLHDCVEDNVKYDYLCLNFWTSLNYGAVLTAYAFQNVLDTLGYKNAHIDYRYPHVIDKFEGSFTDKFARKYLHQTRQYHDYNDFRSLNDIVRRGFIVGSDQVFRDDYITGTFGMYLLAFAAPDKQRLAISASFGKDTFSLKYADKFFKAFDAISVREEDGLKLLEQNKYKNGRHILDPVFLCDKNIFKELAQETKVPEDMVVGYILDETPEIKNDIAQYGNKYINIAKLNLDVEEFVGYFAKAKAVMTDSFHGTCFAILFNKPFRCFYNEERGNSRFESLFKSLGLVSDCLDKEPDWNLVNHRIEDEKRKGINWLKENLEKITPKNKRTCRKLHKLTKKKKHRHSFWWHLRHLKF